jgi:hypothetical protein
LASHDLNAGAKRVARSVIEELQRENAELREWLERFRKLLNNVFEPRMLDFIDPEVKSRMVRAMSPVEIGPHLREVALRCQSLGRESTDPRAALELEEISSELAQRASSLEAIFAVLDATRSS